MRTKSPHQSYIWLRRLLTLFAALLALAILFRLLLDPLAEYYTRKKLNTVEEIKADLQKVNCKILPPGYSITHLKIVESKNSDWDYPLFYAKRAVVYVDWRRLLRAELAVNIRVDRPKVIVNRTTTATPPKDTGIRDLPTLEDTLHELIPARLTRLEVRNGEVLFRDLTSKGQPEIWVHNIEMALENISTRKELAHGTPATLGLHAILGKSGDVALSVSADLFAAKPKFTGTLSLQGYRVAELYQLEKNETQLQTTQGTLDIYAKFKAENGILSGGVKPILKNVEVRPADEGFGNKIKAWVTDQTLDVFSDRIANRNAVATTIPIKGKLENPNVQLWPTFLGIIRNAFVAGISAGFAHLPPPVEKESQGLLSQAKNALNKDKGPPKAQPLQKRKKD